MTKIKDSILNYLTLFGSMSTLICCAIPSLLVSLGLGAALAGAVSSFPQLIWLSENKLQLFIFSGILLTLNGLLILRNKNLPCPIDPKLRDACINGRRNSFLIYMISLGFYLVGAFFAFVLPII